MSDDKCGKCSKIVYVMEALHVENLIYHKTCFKCEKCKKQLNSFGYHLTPSGEIYCKVHKPSIDVRAKSPESASNSRSNSRQSSQESLQQQPQPQKIGTPERTRLPMKNREVGSSGKPRKIGHMSEPLLFGLEDDLPGEQTKQEFMEQHKNSIHSLHKKKQSQSSIEKGTGSKDSNVDNVTDSVSRNASVSSPTASAAIQSLHRSLSPSTQIRSVNRPESASSQVSRNSSRPGTADSRDSRSMSTELSVGGVNGAPNLSNIDTKPATSDGSMGHSKKPSAISIGPISPTATEFSSRGDRLPSVDMASLRNKWESTSSTTSSRNPSRNPSIVDSLPSRKPSEAPPSGSMRGKGAEHPTAYQRKPSDLSTSTHTPRKTESAKKRGSEMQAPGAGLFNASSATTASPTAMAGSSSSEGPSPATRKVSESGTIVPSSSTSATMDRKISVASTVAAPVSRKPTEINTSPIRELQESENQNDDVTDNRVTSPLSHSEEIEEVIAADVSPVDTAPVQQNGSETLAAFVPITAQSTITSIISIDSQMSSTAVPHQPAPADVLPPIATLSSQNEDSVRVPLKSGEEEQMPVIMNRKSMEPNRKSMEPNRKSMEPNRKSMEPNRKSMEPNRKSMEPIRKPIDLNIRQNDPTSPQARRPPSRDPSMTLPKSDSERSGLQSSEPKLAALNQDPSESDISRDEARNKSKSTDLSKFPVEESMARKKSDPLILDHSRKRSNTEEVLSRIANIEKNIKTQNAISVNINKRPSIPGNLNQIAKSTSKTNVEDESGSSKKLIHSRNASKDNLNPPQNDQIMSKNMEEEKRAEYITKQYQKVKLASVQVFRCCGQLQNVAQDSRIGLLQEFVSYFRTVRDALRKYIDLTTAVVASLDLRRNGVDMLKYEILMTTEFLLGNGSSPNAEEFKKLMNQMNVNIDTVMKKYQPASKMMAKSLAGFKEESCFDNDYFIASEVSYETINLEHVLESQYFRQNFVGRDHQTYSGVVDKWGAVIISILKDDISDESKAGAEIYKATERHETLHAAQVKKSILGRKPSIKQILQLLDKDINFSKLKQKDTDRHVEARLITLDEFRYRPKYKFGLVLCKPGQTTDNEYLSNCTGTPAYDIFLNAIATRTKLNGFKGFVGGLDTVHDKTGTEFLYTKWKNFEVMFHCSTMLPYNKDDPQQIERKRHIGNDIINVIYLDGDMQFDPSSIKTQFTHVYILIKAETVQNENDVPVKGYRIAISSSTDVPKFGPPLPNPPVFTDLTVMQKFLMAKLVNAENAALKAPKFSKPNDRARHALFDSIMEEFASPQKEKSSSSRAASPGKDQASQKEDDLKKLFSSGSTSPKKKYQGGSGSMNDLSSSSNSAAAAAAVQAVGSPRTNPRGARFSLIPSILQRNNSTPKEINIQQGHMSMVPLKTGGASPMSAGPKSPLAGKAPAITEEE